MSFLHPGGNAFGPAVDHRKSTDFSRAAAEPKMPGTGRSWAEQTAITASIAAVNAATDGTEGAIKAEADSEANLGEKAASRDKA